jgi:crotonobetainyl-CoA:carnitine CoA-transferase CaiB-like acyl-CoA transferase
MQAGYLQVNSGLTINDGVRDFAPCSNESFVVVADTIKNGVAALSELTPALGMDRTEAYTTSFYQHSNSDTLKEMVERANRHLGSVRIESVVAIYSSDDIAWIRVKAFEGAKERVIYQNPNTSTKNLLVKVTHPFAEDLRETVLSYF